MYLQEAAITKLISLKMLLPNSKYIIDFVSYKMS